MGAQTAALEAGLAALGVDIDASLGVQTAAIVAAVATSSVPTVEAIQLLIDSIKTKDQPNLTNTLNTNTNNIISEIRSKTSNDVVASLSQLQSRLEFILNDKSSYLLSEIYQTRPTIKALEERLEFILNDKTSYLLAEIYMLRPAINAVYGLIDAILNGELKGEKSIMNKPKYDVIEVLKETNGLLVSSNKGSITNVASLIEVTCRNILTQIGG